jgi:glycosyltransferase involved in cell wall biosynthesis
MMPLVSVIIPCYRQAHFLGQAIQSALAQSYPAIEMVVINDGSDDDTESVAQSFGDRIRYHWQPNGGLSAARNAAVSLSTGKYIYCLDADDRLAPEGIEWLVEAAENREDRLCVMGVTTFGHHEAMMQGRHFLPPCDKPLGLELLWHCLGPPIMFLCSRSMLVAVGGFDEKLSHCEDWDLWQRLVFAGAEVTAVPRIGAFYREHPGSHSRNLLLMATRQAEVCRRILRRIDNDPERVAAMGGDPRDMSRMLRKSLARSLFDAGYALRAKGQYFAALQQYSDSIRGGRVNMPAVSGILKLLPHWVLRQIRVSSPASDWAAQNRDEHVHSHRDVRSGRRTSTNAGPSEASECLNGP